MSRYPLLPHATACGRSPANGRVFRIRDLAIAGALLMLSIAICATAAARPRS